MNKCKKYIGHLKRVIPKVIELESAASVSEHEVYSEVVVKSLESVHRLRYFRFCNVLHNYMDNQGHPYL